MNSFARTETSKTLHNLRAEQALLGGIILDNRMLREASETLKPEHFFDPVHGEIFRTCAEIVGRARVADSVSLAEFFQTHPGLKELGGLDYLRALLNMGARLSIHMREYAAVIADLAYRRALVHFGHETASLALEPEEGIDAEAQIARCEQTLRTLAQQGGAASAWITAEEAAGMAIERAQAGSNGVSSGLIDYDRYTFGFEPGGYTILAGRPSMGKTSLALAMARGVAGQGYGAMIVSLEMGAAQLGLRLAFSIADDGIRYMGKPACGTMSEARMKKLTPRQWEMVYAAKRRVGEMPLVLDERGAMTLSKIRAAAGRKLDEWRRRQVRPGVLVLDHLGLIRPEIDRKGNRVQEVSDISSGIKAMAKELDIHVLALCQLNRAVESRDEKRPTLADLRDSGSLEQDADIVTFVYRDAYYLGRIPEEKRSDAENTALVAKRNIVELIVSKQRNGEIGTASVFFDEQTCSVKNLGRQ